METHGPVFLRVTSPAFSQAFPLRGKVSPQATDEGRHCEPVRTWARHPLILRFSRGFVSRLRARGTFAISGKSTQKRRLVDTDCVSLAAAHAPRLAHSVVSPLPTTNASLVCRGSPFCGFKTSFRAERRTRRSALPRDCGKHLHAVSNSIGSASLIAAASLRSAQLPGVLLLSPPKPSP